MTIIKGADTAARVLRDALDVEQLPCDKHKQEEIPPQNLELLSNLLNRLAATAGSPGSQEGSQVALPQPGLNLGVDLTKMSNMTTSDTANTCASSSSLLCLPNEILVEILNHLPFVDWLQASATCSRLRRLSKQTRTSLSLKPAFDMNHVALTAPRLRVAGSATRSRRHNHESRSAVVDRGLTVASHLCPAIEDISLLVDTSAEGLVLGMDVHEVSPQVLLTFVTMHSNLQRICLQGCINVLWSDVTSICSECPMLRSLHYEPHGMDGGAGGSVLDLVPVCDSLEELDTTGTHVFSRASSSLRRRVTSAQRAFFARLKHLSVTPPPSGLSDALALCSGLESLTISDNTRLMHDLRITERVVFTMIYWCTRLRRLRLRGNIKTTGTGLGSEDVIDNVQGVDDDFCLLQALARMNSKLVELDLETARLGVTRAGIHDLVEHCTCLRRLIVSSAKDGRRHDHRSGVCVSRIVQQADSSLRLEPLGSPMDFIKEIRRAISNAGNSDIHLDVKSLQGE